MADDTAKQPNAISAMAEVAATMMRAAFTVPIGAMRAACDLQERTIELMESFVPGLDADREKAAAQAAPPPAGASATAAAASSAGTAGPTTGWGPVTPQTPQTGWGPMPR